MASSSPAWSPERCRALNEHYRRGKVLGRGTFGVVYAGEAVEDGSKVALKKVFSVSGEEGFPSSFLREVSLCLKMNHPNIVKTREVAVLRKREDDRPTFFIVQDFYPLPLSLSLTTHVTSTGRGFDQDTSRALLRQILEGVHYLHVNSVLHRDLKPQNILLSADGGVRIGDFGLARALTVEDHGHPLSPDVVTFWYRAPELLLGEECYTSAIDIWSVACIFVELLRGSPLFPSRGELDQILMYCKTLGPPTTERWPGLQQLPMSSRLVFPDFPDPSIKLLLTDGLVNASGLEFVQALLAYDPAQRLSAEQALAHSYFTSTL